MPQWAGTPPSSRTLKVRVVARQTLALDIDLFELANADRSPLPHFAAGAHIDVHLPGGLVRQYSLCNDPGESHRYQIAVLRDVGGRGGSLAMHESVHVDDVITISAPRNHFPLAQTGEAAVLLAGGIGITPLLSMAEELSRRAHPFELHYCTRSQERTAFRERIAGASFARNVHFYWDDAPADSRLDLDALLRDPRQGIHVYTCGPRGFIDAVLSTARARGWPEAQLHCEFFSAAPLEPGADAGFEIQLARSGQVIRVASDQTAMAALSAAGVRIPYSCEQGVCGTCLTTVLDGEPDHRDSFLTPDEQASNRHFLPCCSRAKSSRLVLDL